MDLIDLARALPGLLLLVLLPGLAAAALLRPSLPGWWRLAIAPAVAIGLIGVTGLIYHDLGIRFELGSVSPMLALITLAAVGLRLRGGRRPSDPEPPLLSRRGGLIAGAALVAGLLTASVTAAALRAQPFPLETDTPIHGYITTHVASGHDVMQPEPMPAAGTTSVRVRVAFEATAALVAQVTGMHPNAAMVPLALLAALVLPLSLAILALEATRDWRIAAVAPLLGLGFTLVTYTVDYGEFPYLADATLVAPMIVSARRALLDVERRRELAAVATFVATAWALHGLEVLTAVVVGGALVVASAWRRPLLDLVRDAAGVALAVAAGAVLVMAITRAPSSPPATVSGGVHAGSQAASFIGVYGPRSQFLHALPDFVRTELVLPAVILYVIGVAAALRVRGMRWALLTHALLLLILADTGYGNFLHRLWTEVFPWSVPDRLVSIQWFVVPLLLSWGVFHAAEAVLPPRPRGRPVPHHQRRLLSAVVAALVVAVVIAGTASTFHLNQQAVATLARSADADKVALATMDRILPPGTLVLTQGALDAGQWTDVVTRDVPWAPLAYTRSFVQSGGIPLLDERGQRLAKACDDPQQALAALDGVGAVYVGARHDPKVRHPWHAECIAALPGVHEAARVDIGGYTAWVFVVAPRQA